MFNKFQDLCMSSHDDDSTSFSDEKSIMKGSSLPNVYLNKGIRKKLRNLIKKYPDGLWCNDLPNAYRAQYNYVLDYREFGCTSIIHFLSLVPDIIRCERPGKGDWKLFDASVPKSTTSNDNCLETDCDVDQSQATPHNRLLPKNVVGPNTQWIEIELNNQELTDSYLNVDIGEVWSPSQFFIHLKKFSHFLDKFMSDLQNFYNNYYMDYKMPDEVIQPKQICVAYYSPSKLTMREEWHRVEILDVVSHQSVIVYMVDFGTVANLKKSHLRYLHRAFLGFPVQAIPAKLVGIEPPNNRNSWPKTTCETFLKLTMASDLEVQVKNVSNNFGLKITTPDDSPDKKSKVRQFLYQLDVILYTSSDPDRRSLNKRLVDENLAVIVGSTLLENDISLENNVIKKDEAIIEKREVENLEEKHEEGEEKEQMPPECYDWVKDEPNCENPITKECDENNEKMIKKEKDSYEEALGDFSSDLEINENQNDVNIHLSGSSFDTEVQDKKSEKDKSPSCLIIKETIDEDDRSSGVEVMERPPTNTLKLPTGLEVSVDPSANQSVLYDLILKEKQMLKQRLLRALDFLSKNDNLLDVALYDPALAINLSYEMIDMGLSTTESKKFEDSSWTKFLFNYFAIQNKMALMEIDKSVENMSSIKSDVFTGSSISSSSVGSLDSMVDHRDSKIKRNLSADNLNSYSMGFTVKEMNGPIKSFKKKPFLVIFN